MLSLVVSCDEDYCESQRQAEAYRTPEMLVGNLWCGKWYASKAVDSREPIIVKWRIDDSVMARSVIKAMLVSHDAHVGKTAEENEGAEFILLVWRGRSETRPKRTCASSFKRNTC